MNHPWFFWATTLPSGLVNGVATLGPAGYWGKAPGTVGTLFGVFFYTAFLFPLGPVGTLLLSGFLVFLAIGFCGEAERRLFRSDPKEVIFDEFVAIPFCFLGLKSAMLTHGMWLYMILGFLIFRFFDIVKPLGINRLQRLEGGLGVVMDDIAAALATCLTLHLLTWFFFQ